MATPTWIAASAAVSAADDPCTLIATMTLTYPATISAGDILIVIVNANSSNTADTVGGLTGYSGIYENGAGTSRLVGAYYKVANGSEDSATFDVTVSFSGTINSRSLAQVHQFSAGTVDLTVGAANSGTSSTPSFASTTTNAANSLAVGIMWYNTSTTINSHVGESGGDWTEATTEATSPGNGMQVQTATMASVGTISGGNSSLGISTTWRNYTFAIEEAAAGIANKFLGGNFAVKRANSF